MTLRTTLLVTALLTGAPPAQAGAIVGGSTLIDAAGLRQLQSWLGKGELSLTKLFSKHAGDVGVDFHAAADARGPTFTVMSALGNGGTTWKTVGGYNPASWDSVSGAHFTPDPADWDAFIFNLSDTVQKRQSNGGQTWNDPFDGPVFGTPPLGPDLGVDASLSSVFSSGWSYGDAFDPVTGTTGDDYRRSIVDDSIGAGNMTLAALEVFTIALAPDPVPAPSTPCLIGAGLLAWWARRGKMRRSGVAAGARA